MNAPRIASAARRLIVSADDFGMSLGVNEAIVRAHREGILTGTSLMVTGAAFADAVERAGECPALDVGLHLVLVQGYAASQPERIPLLSDGHGRFGQQPVWAGMRYFFARDARDQLRREIAAQLERFLAAGLRLSHIDGHLTIHMHPTVLGVLIEMASEYGIRAIRVPREPLLPALRFDRRQPGRKLFEAAVFAALSRRAVRRLASAGIAHADRVFGMHQTGRVSESYLLRLLSALPAGTTEIYTHPALPDEEARRWRPADYQSADELAALISPRVRAAIDSSGIVLTGYRSI